MDVILFYEGDEENVKMRETGENITQQVMLQRMGGGVKIDSHLLLVYFSYNLFQTHPNFGNRTLKQVVFFHYKERSTLDFPIPFILKEDHKQNT